MLYAVIYSLSNLFRIYLLRKYVQIFLGEEMEEEILWREVLAYGSLFVLNTSLSLRFHLIWLNICTNLAGIGLIVFLYVKSIKAVLFITFSIYMIHMGCDVITSFLLGNTNQWNISPASSVTTLFLILICELLLEKLIKGRKSTDNIFRESPSGAGPEIEKDFYRNIRQLPHEFAPPQAAGALILVPFSSIVAVWILVSVLDPEENRIAVIIACSSLLVLNFLVFRLYDMLRKAFSQQYENEILRQKVVIYTNQMDIILQNEDKAKALRHDMKHHMNELKLLAIKSNDIPVQEYIDSMEEFIRNPKEIVSSGNTEIDSVLNYMLSRAKEELKEVTIDIQLPEDVSHSFDINVILGNLLENAIEAARETEEKLLNVKIRLRQGVLRIEVENSFEGVLLFAGGSGGKDIRQNSADREGLRFLTTKENRKIHGLGLGSVKKVVEKHNGIMEAYPEGKRFIVKLILYM